MLRVVVGDCRGLCEGGSERDGSVTTNIGCRARNPSSNGAFVSRLRASLSIKSRSAEARFAWSLGCWLVGAHFCGEVLGQVGEHVFVHPLNPRTILTVAILALNSSVSESSPTSLSISSYSSSSGS